MMSPVRNRFLLACLLAVWLTAVPTAFGHSVVERSDPVANASLEVAPQRLRLWFSEPVDPAFTSATVLDQSGQSLSGPATTSADGLNLVVPLTGISRGVFSVRWRVLSAVDGHTTTGFYIFSVGTALPAGSATEGTGATVSSLLRIAVRWSGYAAAIVLAGGLTFQLFVLRPALRSVPRDDAGLLARSAELGLRRAAAWAVGVLIASQVMDLGLQIGDLVAGPISAARGVFWAFLFGTRPGWSAMVQAGMAALILVPRSARGRILQAAAVLWVMIIAGIVTVLGGPAAVIGSSHVGLVMLAASVYALLGVWMAAILPQIPDIRIPELPGVPVVAGVGVLVGISLASHAAGGGALALLGDWLHLGAATLWIGGLASLLISLRSVPSPQRGRLAHALVPRTSVASGLGLLVILASGAYAVWLNIPAYPALLVTPYGRTLLVKLMLVACIAGLGAYNRFVLRPAIVRAGDVPARLVDRVSRFVAAEVAVGAGVLLVVAALTLMPPARVTYRTDDRKPVVLSGMAGDVSVRMTITPSRPGADRFEVVAADAGGRPRQPDVSVRLRMTKLDEDLRPVAFALTPHPGGRHAGEGGELSLDGWWQVDVIVRQKDRPDVTTSFPFRRGRQVVSPPDPEAGRLLQRARTTAGGLRSWREDEQLSDGLGNLIVTGSEFQPPRRLRYHTSIGLEGVIIDTVHYVRTASGRWQEEMFSQAGSFDGALGYLRDAQHARLGRTAGCADEPCRVVLWESADGTAAFAGWIGLSSGRLTMLLMIARSHFMTLELSAFNAPIAIEAPK